MISRKILFRYVLFFVLISLAILYNDQELLEDTFYPWIRSPPDLHPPGLQVVDIKDFQFLINNNICNQTQISLVTIVSSAIPHKADRRAIRQTWGRPDIAGVNTRLVFLLGKTRNQRDQDLLELENTEHGDLVQGAFMDTYRNLTYKNIMGKLWITQFCKQAEFVIKTDDDTYIDLYAVHAFTRKYLNTADYNAGSLLLGPVKSGRKVNRGGKWAVSFEDIPESEPNYPKFCNSIFYIFNPATAARLAQIAKSTKHLWIDDVYVTGFLRRTLNITMIDTGKFQMLRAKNLLKRKAILSPNLYLKDYMNTLVGRGKTRIKLYFGLHQYAKWCYYAQCRTNIYYPDYKPEKWEKVAASIIMKTAK